MTLDLATVDELLTTTRAVRKRLDLTRPVPLEVVLDCLRLATQAPSATKLTWPNDRTPELPMKT